MKYILRLFLTFSILIYLPFMSLAQSTNWWDYDIDYGCWGTITVEVGATKTVSNQYTIPYPSKVKSIVWSSQSSDFCAITSQNNSSCIIKGVYPYNNLQLWCLMKYGDSTYRAYYNVNIIKSSHRATISANPSGGEVVEGSTVRLSIVPEELDEEYIIYYTLDGSTPTKNSLKYNDFNGIKINESCTLKAFATGYTYADTDVITAIYTTAYKKGATFTEKTVEGVDMTFKVTDATAKVVEVSSVDKNTSGIVTIPSEIKGYKVTRIGNSAFYGCTNLTAVSIPNSVTTIGGSAFSECKSLTSIEIPNSVTSIGDYTFEHCSSLTSIEIPNTVTSIGRYAFHDCSNLVTIEIPNSVKDIGRYAFFDCSNLATIEIPNTVTDIGFGAFYRCSSLKSVTLPTSLSRIENYTFYDCTALEEIKGGKNIEYIGSYAFALTLWQKNLPDGMNFLGKVLFNYNGEVPANTAVSVPSGCTQIYNYAFDDKDGLVEINISASVSDIGEDAFRNCPNLQTITVDASNSVYDSRNNCNAVIKKATNTLTHGCSGTTIPTNVTSIGADAFYGNWTKEEVIIPNQIDSIASLAFYNCSNVKSILIGKGLRKLGSAPFAQLPHLKEIAVSTSNPYFDSRDNCNAIIEKATNTLVVGCSTTTIPNSVKTIGSYAFYGNGDEDFTSLVIPNSVEEIKSYAFGSLPYLREVSIGTNVKTFGNYMFYKCNNLEAIESLNGFPDDIDEKVFDSGSKDFSIYDNVTLYVPAGCRNNYRLATGWSNFKNIVEGSLPVGVDDALTTQPKEEVIYSPTGVRLSAPQRGVNIVNGKKLLVK